MVHVQTIANRMGCGFLAQGTRQIVLVWLQIHVSICRIERFNFLLIDPVALTVCEKGSLADEDLLCARTYQLA